MTKKRSEANVVPLLPLHAVGDARRGRGRPPKVEPKPTASDLQYHAAITAERSAHVAADPLVMAVAGGDPQKVLEQTAAVLAMEAAALGHLQLEVAKRGRDFSMISSRRASILNELTKTQIKLRDLSPDLLDLRSEGFQRVFKIWIQDLVRIAQEVLPPEQFDVLTNKLENELVGWEDRVEAMLR